VARERFVRLFALAVTSCLPCLPAAAQPLPTVVISNWAESTNGTGVVFKNLLPTEVAGEGIKLPNLTSDGKFEYGIDASDMSWANECRCFRYIVVTVKSVRTRRVSQHKIREVPTGTFDDQRVPLKLNISDGHDSDSDDISLPIGSGFGLGPLPKVAIRPRQNVGPVSLNGQTELQLTIENPNADMEMVIPSEIVVESDHASLWRQPPVIVGSKFPLRIAAKGRETIRLQLDPDTWKAARESFTPTSNDKAHTAVRLKWSYANPVFNQREISSETEIPIRFHPSLFTLAVALLSGVLLGSLVLFLRQRNMALRSWSRAALTALLASLVFELVAIFLVANNSKFVVFNFDLDPWQTLPVALLGTFNGLLGIEAAAQLKALVTKQERS